MIILFTLSQFPVYIVMHVCVAQSCSVICRSSFLGCRSLKAALKCYAQVNAKHQTSAHKHTATHSSSGLVICLRPSVQLDVFCGEQAASPLLPTYTPTHTNSHSHICIKLHVHTPSAWTSTFTNSLSWLCLMNPFCECLCGTDGSLWCCQGDHPEKFVRLKCHFRAASKNHQRAAVTSAVLTFSKCVVRNINMGLNCWPNSMDGYWPNELIIESLIMMWKDKKNDCIILLSLTEP